MAADKIATIGITNQRETTIIWDKATKQPLHNAIIWQDIRNADIVSSLITQHNNNKDHFRPYCGLPISTYFFATKIAWLYNNIPRVKHAINNNTCLFGTVDTWILYNFIENNPHLTDTTNASRTMLMNINTLQWDKYLCESFNVPMSILPRIVKNNYQFGAIGNKYSFKGIKVRACIGDQQSATYGQFCVNKGNAKNTLGTGAFLMYNTGDDIVESKSGLLTTVLSSFDGNRDNKFGKFNTAFALEGFVTYILMFFSFVCKRNLYVLTPIL